MKKLVVASVGMALFCLAVSGQSGGDRPLSFEQALDMAMGGNPQIEAAKYEEMAAAQERKAAVGLRFPKLGLTGAYVYMGDDLGIDLNSYKAGAQDLFNGVASGLAGMGITPDPALIGAAGQLFGSSWDITLQKRDFAFVGGTLTMPVFMGGKINAANRAARINEQTARRRSDQMRGALISELVERYFGLSLAEQAVNVRRQAAEAMRSHLRDAVALENNGVIARSERLYVEVKLAEAERDLMAAQLQASTTRSALSSTLGSGEGYTPVSGMFVLGELPTLELLKSSALRDNPQLQQVELKRQLAQEGVKAQRAEFMPQVAIMGAGKIYDHQVSKYLPTWVIGGGVTINIFDGLQREHKYNAARYTVRQVEALQQKAESDISILVENLYNELLNYAERMPSIEASLEFAQEYLRVRDAAFREGAGTSSDVIDAELNLAAVKIEKLRTAYNYDLLLARLLEAAGMSGHFPEYTESPLAETVMYE